MGPKAAVADVSYRRSTLCDMKVHVRIKYQWRLLGRYAFVSIFFSELIVMRTLLYQSTRDRVKDPGGGVSNELTVLGTWPGNFPA